MFKLITKRLLLLIPTLLVISVLTFFLSQGAPGDPVEQSLETDNQFISSNQYLELYKQAAENMGLDKPTFYVSLTTAAFPDTLYKIAPKAQKKVLSQLINQYGNWPLISNYHHNLKGFEQQFSALPDSITSLYQSILMPAIKQLYLHSDDKIIQHHLGTIEKKLLEHQDHLSYLAASFDSLRLAYQQVIDQPTRYKSWIPKLHWYGTNNQYHQWLKKILQGDLGISKIDGKHVGTKIMDAMKWTLLINGLAILLAYGISIAVGIFSAVRKNSKWDRGSTLFLFLLHSLPNFWIAILLIIFVTNPEYGMDWFPPNGTGDLPDQATFWQVIQIRAAHLTLPIICITYPALAFISRQMRGAMVNELEKDYIRTAYAKGVPSKRVIWKHAFRNALFPIITMFASIFPAAIAGSIVIEHIFGIPGMGRLMISSINQQDWPVVFGILIFASILTILGLLVADVLYALADPRVKINKT